MNKLITLAFLFLFFYMQSNAQLTDEYKKSAPSSWVYALRSDYGSVIVHSPSVKPIAGAKPFGFGFEISKQATDSATYHLCSAFPRVGFQFEYFHYGTPILGNTGTISYFIQPVYRLNNRINFFYRGAFGLCYSDNPFNPNSPIDTLNQNFSLRYNPYLQVGAGFGFKVSKHLSLDVSGTFDHISNGNIKRPNRGLNWTTASLALVYKPDGNDLPRLRRVHDKFWKSRSWEYRTGALYVFKQDYAGTSMGYQRMFAAGGFVEAAKQIGRIHGIVTGLQVFHNEFKDDPQNPDAPVWKNKHSSVLAGIYGGHEFLMGRFIFSQVIGLYVTPHPNFYTNLFHQHSLRYLIDKKWQIGFALRAHQSDADFICWNVICKW